MKRGSEPTFAALARRFEGSIGCYADNAVIPVYRRHNRKLLAGSTPVISTHAIDLREFSPREGYAKMPVEAVGDPGWTESEMRESYEEFKALYSTRPVRDNAGGMNAPHAFGTWFMLRRLNPPCIVESGVWKGQGTWLIEKACPDAELICLDIDLSRVEYLSKKAIYYEKDFSLIDLGDAVNPESLCFFDDHQSALLRLQQMKWKGFFSAIFEDNYPKFRGDCYSPKKILSGYGFAPEQSKAQTRSVKIALRKMIRGSTPEITAEPIVEKNTTHRNELLRALEIYYEFPPLFKELKTRWGDPWNDEYYPTKEPIWGTDIEDELRNEAQAYTWMCYLKLAR